MDTRASSQPPPQSHQKHRTDRQANLIDGPVDLLQQRLDGAHGCSGEPLRLLGVRRKGQDPGQWGGPLQPRLVAQQQRAGAVRDSTRRSRRNYG